MRMLNTSIVPPRVYTLYMYAYYAHAQNTVRMFLLCAESV